MPLFQSHIVLLFVYHYSNPKHKLDNTDINSYKLMPQSYKQRKKKWKTKTNTLQNYIYIRSLLSHYDRTPNGTSSLTLALQQANIKKKNKNLE